MNDDLTLHSLRCSTYKFWKYQQTILQRVRNGGQITVKTYAISTSGTISTQMCLSRIAAIFVGLSLWYIMTVQSSNIMLPMQIVQMSQKSTVKLHGYQIFGVMITPSGSLVESLEACCGAELRTVNWEFLSWEFWIVSVCLDTLRSCRRMLRLSLGQIHIQIFLFSPLVLNWICVPNCVPVSS
jgi:hypothetical protein